MSDKKDHKINVVNIRLVKEPSLYSPDPIKSPEDVVKVIAKELAAYDREVFKSCILSNAGAFICLHNHPTGSLSPSQEDKDITKVLLEASKIMDIHMLDHIIVAAETGEIYSFKEDGLLDQLRVRSQSWER